MTREEAIANLNMISVAFVGPVTKEQRKLIDDTFEMAFKALEQITKIAEMVAGTIDHFDYEDAMEMLYDIKDIVEERR